MMIRIKVFLFAIAGICVANLALAQERERRPLKFSPESHQYWREKQEKFDKRINAANKRATRSICADQCKEPRRPPGTEADQWAESMPDPEATYQRARTPYEMQLDGEGRPSE